MRVVGEKKHCFLRVPYPVFCADFPLFSSPPLSPFSCGTTNASLNFATVSTYTRGGNCDFDFFGPRMSFYRRPAI